MVGRIAIADRPVGEGAPCFVIAEAGVNHNGQPALAHALIEAAAAAKADAVKFQTFKADRLALASAPKAAYQKRNEPGEESQLAMLRRLELPDDVVGELAVHCRERGILFLSSPFDEESADFLDTLGMAAFKVPSGELTNAPFLRHLAGKGKPLIVSTGMADMAEVKAAVDTIRAAGAPPLALLHCVSAYPADPADCNLGAMAALARAFGVPIGWSDHTTGIDVAIAAVALGATIVEKHFTTDRALPGPDHRASLEPSELAALMTAVRRVESALGSGVKRPAASEADTAGVARKSLVAVRDLAAGTVIAAADLAARRPGTGLPPSRQGDLLGRRLKVDVAAGEQLTLAMVE
ncbi:N-acetylneuraminate synthase [Shumkonia mesophila]|uniref:N-acetylneuraminate synthase n=1 Tax=Shumkonia mesophila TaxID=2838854 RepID=UPI0029352464|nr:N-acetylneuraminate synthase [Shumkonia mesophila]